MKTGGETFNALDDSSPPLCGQFTQAQQTEPENDEFGTVVTEVTVVTTRKKYRVQDA